MHIARIHLDAHTCIPVHCTWLHHSVRLVSEGRRSRCTAAQGHGRFRHRLFSSIWWKHGNPHPCEPFPVGETGPAEWPGRITARVHSYELARCPRPDIIADRFCSQVFLYPLSWLVLRQLPSQANDGNTTAATIVLSSNDDLHRDYSVNVLVLSKALELSCR